MAKQTRKKKLTGGGGIMDFIKSLFGVKKNLSVIDLISITDNIIKERSIAPPISLYTYVDNQRSPFLESQIQTLNNFSLLVLENCDELSKECQEKICKSVFDFDNDLLRTRFIVMENIKQMMDSYYEERLQRVTEALATIDNYVQHLRDEQRNLIEFEDIISQFGQKNNSLKSCVFEEDKSSSEDEKKLYSSDPSKFSLQTIAVQDLLYKLVQNTYTDYMITYQNKDAEMQNMIKDSEEIAASLDINIKKHVNNQPNSVEISELFEKRKAWFAKNPIISNLPNIMEKHRYQFQHSSTPAQQPAPTHNSTGTAPAHQHTSTNTAHHQVDWSFRLSLVSSYIHYNIASINLFQYFKKKKCLTYYKKQLIESIKGYDQILKSTKQLEEYQTILKEKYNYERHLKKKK